MRAQAAPRRRAWPWIIAALLVIAAIIIGVSIATGGWGAGVSPTLSVPPTSTVASSTPEGATGDPTGCLGGPDRDAAMVARASEAATQDEAGAVEFAAAFVRWIQRYPYPSADEAMQVQSKSLATPSFTDDLPAYLAAEPDLSGGIVAPGSDYFMSTVPGVWYTESFNGDDAVISIGSGFVIGGEVSANLRSSITISLKWDDDRWRVSDAEGTRTTADLYQIGTEFKEGC